MSATSRALSSASGCGKNPDRGTAPIRESFIELGYHGASLRQIAARAHTHTTQAMLYRNFPSNAALFEQSVLRPFEDFVADLVAN